MTISEIASKAGIGKGTFYHFYKAKEFYIYDMIQYSNEGLERTFNDIAEKTGGIDREALEKLLSVYSFHGKDKHAL